MSETATNTSRTTYSVEFNGEPHTMTLDGDAPVDAIKQRLSEATGLPRASLKLCCAVDERRGGKVASSKGTLSV